MGKKFNLRQRSRTQRAEKLTVYKGKEKSSSNRQLLSWNKTPEQKEEKRIPGSENKKKRGGGLTN